MPYKDPERKKEWERSHRAERLARRRQLRQNEAARPAPRQAPSVELGDTAIPAITSDAQDANSPRVGITVGALALVSSAAFKKAWVWWLLGCVLLVVFWLFYWRNLQVPKAKSTKTT